MFRICHFAREDNSSSFAMSIFMATYLITIKELHWQHIHFHIKKKKTTELDFLDGPMVENLPADAWNTGSIPDPGSTCHTTVTELAL